MEHQGKGPGKFCASSSLFGENLTYNSLTFVAEIIIESILDENDEEIDKQQWLQIATNDKKQSEVRRETPDSETKDEQDEDAQKSWNCPVCTFSNDSSSTTCSMCHLGSRPSAANTTDDHEQDVDAKQEEEDEQDEEEEEKKEERGETVRVWLRETVKLPQYASFFIEEGFDELDIVLNNMSASDLKEIGVNKLGHRKEIMRCIQAEKQKRNNNNNNNNNNESDVDANAAYGAYADDVEGANVMNTAPDGNEVVAVNVQDTLQ